MDSYSWKRNLFPTYYRSASLKETRGSNHATRVVGSETLMPTKDTSAGVVSQQTPEDEDGNEVLYSTILAGVALLVLLIAMAIIFLKKRKHKSTDEEQQAASILIYPSQQGTSASQLPTKEIHFSLPPLRSTSLGDLNEQDQDDSDLDTESLLLPVVHNQRSNSFSCYGLGVIEPALYKNTLDLDEIQWPDGHIGRLWFSLRYEPSTEKLLVSLLKAKNLPSRTIGTVNSCDPFVRLHLMPDERRYLQSKQRKKTCNPYFDETLVFQVSAKDMSDHILKLTVIDGGRTKRKAEIGHITYPLKELEIGDGTEQQLFKMDLEKEVQEIKSDVGELLISLVYNENLSRLTATIIEARRLKSSTNNRARNANTMSAKDNELILPRVKLTPNKGFDNHAITIDEPLFIPRAKRRTAEDVVRIARTAFASGKTKDVEYRRRQLKALMRMLQENEARFADAMKSDFGKPKLEAVAYDVEVAVNEIRGMLLHLKEYAGVEKPKKDLVNLLDGVFVYKDPYGVVLVMGAWNYPIQLTIGPVVGAIAAGNCVIIKPSELSPASAALLAELTPNYLDPACYQVYLGGIEETTELLKERFDYIFFTGSTMVGKIIHQSSSKYLTPTTLELGGKSPVYLDGTVNFEIATKRILWGKCMNAGQSCVAPDYLLCNKQVQEKFVATAQKVLADFFGDDPKESESFGRIVSDRHFHRLENLLRGCKIAIGGQTDAKERYIAPTILTDVNPNSPIMQEEIFGPILPIVVINSVQEAVDFINAREKPLALYIFSSNKKDRDFVLKNTSSGGVAVNDVIAQMVPHCLPFGGVGGSGMGSYHGKATFDTFTHKKSVLVKNYFFVAEKMQGVRYPPYSDAKLSMMKVAVKTRRGVSLKYLPHVIIFCLGLGVAFLYQYLYAKVNDKE